MTNLHLEIYRSEDGQGWDDFVTNANNGTIFHQLSFLSYHGDRFKAQEHHLAWWKGDQLFCVLPMGIFPEGGRKIARSPFGASWGGLVHPVNFGVKYALQAVDLLIAHLSEQGVQECFITTPPSCYFRKYTNVFEYALFAKGFRPAQREISHVVPLTGHTDAFEVMDSKCRNQSRKALTAFTIHENASPEEFYPILLADKKRHDGAVPTHSLEDLIYLQKKFPGRVVLDVAVNPEGAKAGVCYFDFHPDCRTVFYLAQEDECLGWNGLNALLAKGLQRAIDGGRRSVDFGCSSLQSQIQNPGVAEFKEGFGAVGLFRDTFRLVL